MKKDVDQYIKSCDVCQRNKSELWPYPGLLQPLPIPNQVWSQISMAFIEGLHLSEGCDTILVVVDKMTKFSHFSLKHPLKLRKWLKCSWIRCSNSMGYQKSLFLIEINYLQATSGECLLNS